MIAKFELILFTLNLIFLIFKKFKINIFDLFKVSKQIYREKNRANPNKGSCGISPFDQAVTIFI